jgi:hypothetical protein
MLIWRAIPQEHDYSIIRSAITLTYPPKATLLDKPTLSRSFESASTGNRITLTSSGLAANEDLILTARFASNSVTQIQPQWQAKDSATSQSISRNLAARHCRSGSMPWQAVTATSARWWQ